VKNFTMKTMCACGKEVTEQACIDQRINERLYARIIRKTAPHTFARVPPAEPKRDRSIYRGL